MQAGGCGFESRSFHTPGGGMADATVLKAVVKRRVGSSPTQGISRKESYGNRTSLGKTINE